MQDYGRKETVASKPGAWLENSVSIGPAPFRCRLLLQAKGFFRAFSSRRSASFQAFKSGTSSRSWAPNHNVPLTKLSSEPNPNINLWNHKAITKLRSIFLIERKGRGRGERQGEGEETSHTVERFELKSNVRYFLASAVEQGLQEVLWIWPELNVYFAALLPWFESWFSETTLISPETAFNAILASNTGVSQ